MKARDVFHFQERGDQPTEKVAGTEGWARLRASIEGEPVALIQKWRVLELIALAASQTEAAQLTQYLQEEDQHLLNRFMETTEDDEGFDIGMDAVKRLADLGVVRNCGFGRYAVTMFGHWVHEHFWHQNPPLPLMTNTDRAAAKKANLAVKKGDA